MLRHSYNIVMVCFYVIEKCTSFIVCVQCFGGQKAVDVLLRR